MLRLKHPNKLTASELSRYEPYQYIDKKEQFRRDILNILGDDSSHFLKIYEQFEQYGIAMFNNIASDELFIKFMNEYEKLMSSHAIQITSLSHSFITLKEHPDFLSNEYVKDLLLDPISILVFSYYLGAPVAIVEGRAKDTSPIQTKYRDNGPHQDESPFKLEFKIFISWDKGTSHGPSTQPFVAISGSHKLVRIRTTEHAANFNNLKVLDEEIFQNDEIKKDVFVIEAKDIKPLKSIFITTQLVHHRYRNTEDKKTRSCILLPFHNINRIQYQSSFIDKKYLKTFSKLQQFVLNGFWDQDKKTDLFLQIIKDSKNEISQKLIDTVKYSLVDVQSKKMSPKQLDSWRKTISNTSLLNDIKPRLVHSDTKLSDNIFNIIVYDAHWDLDLTLYEDGHEHIRVYSRTIMREQELSKIKEKLSPLMEEISSIDNVSAIMQPDELSKASFSLHNYINSLDMKNYLSKEKFLKSLSQLSIDLSNSVTRCSTAQDYRTNSLFIFLSYFEAIKILQNVEENKLLDQAKNLLQHYLSLVFHDDTNNIPETLRILYAAT